MSGQDETGKTGTTGKADRTSEREARLAEALRQNLRRRKAQARRRKAERIDGEPRTPERR